MELLFLVLAIAVIFIFFFRKDIKEKINPEKYLRAQELGLLPALKGLAALCEVEIIDLVKK